MDTDYSSNLNNLESRIDKLNIKTDKPITVSGTVEFTRKDGTKAKLYVEVITAGASNLKSECIRLAHEINQTLMKAGFEPGKEAKVKLDFYAVRDPTNKTSTIKGMGNISFTLMGKSSSAYNAVPAESHYHAIPAEPRKGDGYSSMPTTAEKTGITQNYDDLSGLLKEIPISTEERQSSIMQEAKKALSEAIDNRDHERVKQLLKHAILSKAVQEDAELKELVNNYSNSVGNYGEIPPFNPDAVKAEAEIIEEIKNMSPDEIQNAIIQETIDAEIEKVDAAIKNVQNMRPEGIQKPITQEPVSVMAETAKSEPKKPVSAMAETTESTVVKNLEMLSKIKPDALTGLKFNDTLKTIDHALHNLYNIDSEQKPFYLGKEQLIEHLTKIQNAAKDWVQKYRELLDTSDTEKLQKRIGEYIKEIEKPKPSFERALGPLLNTNAEISKAWANTGKPMSERSQHVMSRRLGGIYMQSYVEQNQKAIQSKLRAKNPMIDKKELEQESLKSARKLSHQVFHRFFSKLTDKQQKAFIQSNLLQFYQQPNTLQNIIDFKAPESVQFLMHLRTILSEEKAVSKPMLTQFNKVFTEAGIPTLERKL